jgi:hypothetical protein
MTDERSRSYLIGRRAELIAELFLQDLNALFVTKPTPDLGYDFFVGFQNPQGGINNYVVQVKSTERPIQGRHPISAALYERLAYSNIPALLLVVDVKRNQIFHAWITPEIAVGHSGRRWIMVPVVEINDAVKDELRRRLSG